MCPFKISYKYEVWPPKPFKQTGQDASHRHAVHMEWDFALCVPVQTYSGMFLCLGMTLNQAPKHLQQATCLNGCGDFFSLFVFVSVSLKMQSRFHILKVFVDVLNMEIMLYSWSPLYYIDIFLSFDSFEGSTVTWQGCNWLESQWNEALVVQGLHVLSMSVLTF